MSNKVLKMGMVAAVSLAFAIGVAAQHERAANPSQAQSTPAPPEAAKPGMMNGGMVGGGMMSGGAIGGEMDKGNAPGMMGGGIMGMMTNMMHGQMGQMMTQHQEMADTMNKMIQSMSAIESEKDPAALKAKMAEHRALMEKMRDQMSEQGGMMHMMMGGMMGADKPAAETPKPPAK